MNFSITYYFGKNQANNSREKDVPPASVRKIRDTGVEEQVKMQDLAASLQTALQLRHYDLLTV
jgi:hypothetical protein